MSQQNIEIVRRAYEAFTRGDVPAILEMCGDRIESWEVVTAGPWKAPWHKPARNKDEIAGFFQTLIGTLEPLTFEWQHLAAVGDYVYATTQQVYRVRKNGKTFTLRDTMHRFKIVGGKVVGWIANEDSLQTRDVLEG